MKYLYDWLKELLGKKKTPEQLAEPLTMEVSGAEGIEKTENNITGVVVGKILEISKHRMDVCPFPEFQTAAPELMI